MMDFHLEAVNLWTTIRRFLTPKHVHKSLLWIWLLVGAFLNFVLGWQRELWWISFMSLYAIVVGHWSGLEASKAEEEAKPRGYNA